MVPPCHETGVLSSDAEILRWVCAEVVRGSQLDSGAVYWMLWVGSWIIAMPIYEYELIDGDCKVCGGKFTLNRPLDAAPLTQCPACKKPVRKLFSSFNSPKTVSFSDAKKAGFTVLKRVSKGEYERQ